MDVSIQDFKPQPGVKFGYALNLSVCIGCRKCAEACHHENNHDRPSHNSYIRVLENVRTAGGPLSERARQRIDQIRFGTMPSPSGMETPGPVDQSLHRD
mgnify:CR=1 FL=1